MTSRLHEASILFHFLCILMSFRIVIIQQGNFLVGEKQEIINNVLKNQKNLSSWDKNYLEENKPF